MSCETTKKYHYSYMNFFFTLGMIIVIVRVQHFWIYA